MSATQFGVHVSNALLVPVISIFQLEASGTLLSPKLLLQLPELNPDELVVISRATSKLLTGVDDDTSVEDDLFYLTDDVSQLEQWLAGVLARDSGSEQVGRRMAAEIASRIHRHLKGAAELKVPKRQSEPPTGMYL